VISDDLMHGETNVSGYKRRNRQTENCDHSGTCVLNSVNFGLQKTKIQPQFQPPKTVKKEENLNYLSMVVGHSLLLARLLGTH